MKKLIAFVLLAVALCATAFADDVVAPATSAGFSAANIVLWLTPVLTPLIIAGFKKVSPNIPTWLLPLLAPVLGVALDYINHFVSGSSLNLATAALLGLAGVGIREVKDQLAPAAPAPVGPSP